MNKPHYLVCDAPICQSDPNLDYKNNVVWYPGEKVCLKKPYQDFQKQQLEINKAVKRNVFKQMNKPYTARELEMEYRGIYKKTSLQNSLKNKGLKLICSSWVVKARESTQRE